LARAFWREVWRPALELAKLPYRPPYNLRHTFAYWSLRAGVPIATVAREMGHTSTEQTFRVYGGLVSRDGSRRRRDAHRVGRTR
jgi:integrase